MICHNLPNSAPCGLIKKGIGPWLPVTDSKCSICPKGHINVNKVSSITARIGCLSFNQTNKICGTTTSQTHDIKSVSGYSGCWHPGGKCCIIPSKGCFSVMRRTSCIIYMWNPAARRWDCFLNSWPRTPLLFSFSYSNLFVLILNI